MARKKVMKKERRINLLALKANEDEAKKIKHKAKLCGLTVSEFMRQQLLGYEPKQTLTGSELKLLNTLRSCRTDLLRNEGWENGMPRSMQNYLSIENVNKRREIMVKIARYVAIFLEKAGVLKLTHEEKSTIGLFPICNYKNIQL